jgi:hypothetical protein
MAPVPRDSAELRAMSDFVRKDIGLGRKIEHDPDRVRQWLRLEWH